jgi:hypothetical protein
VYFALSQDLPRAEMWMVGLRRNGIRPLVVAVLLFGAGAVVFAHAGPAQASPTRSIEVQSSGPGTLIGKLTDLHSVPLAGVAVVLRNVATGAESRTITAKNGSYLFTALTAGAYTLEADSSSLGHGHLEDIEVMAVQQAHVQVAMRFEPYAPGSLAPAVFQAFLQATPAWRTRLESPQVAVSLESTPLLTQRLPIRLVPAPVNALLLAASLAAVPGPVQTPLFIAASATAPRQTLPLPIQTVSSSIGTVVVSQATAVAPIESSSPRPVQIAEQQADPVSPAVTTTITASEIQALPASGRRWQEFVLDTQAVSNPAGSSQAALRGAGQDPADATIDGVSIRTAFGAASSSGPGTLDSGVSLREGNEQNSTGQAWNGRRGMGISEAAVREVQTVAGNVEARGEHAAGGRTNVETEHGGNELHGQGFFFDRQNNWGARNPFTQWVQNTGTVASPVFTSVPYTPPDHETVWGLGAGSRIRRNKIFWFGALDGYRRNDPGLAMAKNPSEFFETLEPTSPQITLLSAQLGETKNQAYNDYLGIPAAGYTAAGLEQLDNLLGPAPRTATQWTGFARLDWKATERHSFSLEGIGANWNSAGGGLGRVSETYGNHSFGSRQASEEWLLARWEAFLTPNLLAVSQVSVGHDVESARPETPSAFEQGLLKGNSYNQLPQIVVDSSYGFILGNPSRFGQGSYPDERLIHAQEMIDWVHGKWLVKGGVEVNHNSDATSLLRNQTGTYTYSKVENFIADALAFEKFGLTNLLNFSNPHNCNPANNGLGALPCYSYYSQTMGPTHWNLATTDWAGYVTAQWQPNKLAVFSAGLRWEREQLPPPISVLTNPQPQFAEAMPNLGNEWGPRISLAVGSTKSHWPILRLGYGIYYGRTENATIEIVLTQTGSLNGDLNFFIRPTDGLNPRTVTSAAPPFPYVLTGPPASVIKPGAVEFAPNFKNPEGHQAVVAVEESLPGHMQITASAMVSLGRRLPVSIDTNFDPSVNPGTITTVNPGITYAVKDSTGQGPIKASQITVPFYATWPSATAPTGTAGRLNTNYQQMTEIMSRANSTYEAAVLRLSRYGRRGLSLHANYTYAHAMDWNPNESTLVAGSDVLDPENFSLEYGTSNLDVRHSASAMVIYETPWKLHGLSGRLANGWMLSGIGQFHSGRPYTMRVTGSLPKEFDLAGNAIVGLGPGMNGSGGDNRIYGMGNDRQSYNIGRNTYRYPYTWKADIRLGKSFDLGKQRRLELIAESFNLFNHQNVTELETTGYSIESGGSSGSLPTLCYLTINTTTGNANCGTTTTFGSGTPLPAFGQPLNINATNFYRERQIQFGLRMKF